MKTKRKTLTNSQTPCKRGRGVAPVGRIMVETWWRWPIVTRRDGGPGVGVVRGLETSGQWANGGVANRQAGKLEDGMGGANETSLPIMCLWQVGYAYPRLCPTTIRHPREILGRARPLGVSVGQSFLSSTQMGLRRVLWVLPVEMLLTLQTYTTYIY